MSNVLAFLGRDMAVDLGTANTLVYVGDAGSCARADVVAMNTNEQSPCAVGVEAKRMIGPHAGAIMAIRPMKDGVIADFDVTQGMLRYFIQKVHQLQPCWPSPARGGAPHRHHRGGAAVR